MAFETLGPEDKRTAVATADLSSYQYRFVTLGASGIALNTVAGGACAGVLQDKPVSGQAGAYAKSGRTKVVAGAAVTAGVRVSSDTTGRAIAATTGHFSQGQAITAASGAGAIITVELLPASAATA